MMVHVELYVWALVRGYEPQRAGGRSSGVGVMCRSFCPLLLIHRTKHFNAAIDERHTCVTVPVLCFRLRFLLAGLRASGASCTCRHTPTTHPSLRSPRQFQGAPAHPDTLQMGTPDGLKTARSSAGQEQGHQPPLCRGCHVDRQQTRVPHLPADPIAMGRVTNGLARNYPHSVWRHPHAVSQSQTCTSLSPFGYACCLLCTSIYLRSWPTAVTSRSELPSGNRRHARMPCDEYE